MHKSLALLLLPIFLACVTPVEEVVWSTGPLCGRCIGTKCEEWAAYLNPDGTVDCRFPNHPEGERSIRHPRPAPYVVCDEKPDPDGKFCCVPFDPEIHHTPGDSEEPEEIP